MAAHQWMVVTFPDELMYCRQIRNLEMLKTRFGETNLQSCEVMIKDFADSKRFEQYLHQDRDIPTTEVGHMDRE